MTTDELIRLFPHASAEFIRRNASDAPNRDRASLAPPTILERGYAAEPLEADQTQTRNTGKFIVRVTSFRVRLLDEDNLCEKYLVDGLRYAGALPSDAPDRCRIITTQAKVAKKADERTEIVIEQIAE